MPRLRCGSGNRRPWFWSRGANIEVCTEEEGFRGAWFPAKILEPPPPSSRKRKSLNSNKVLVQYGHYVTEEDPNKPLTELAWKVFEAGDDVDAFHNGAWWPGVVMSVEVGERYKVGFEDPPDLLVVGRSEVRCHLDWVNQIWSRPIKSKPMKNLIYNRESPVEYKSPNQSDKDGIATAAVADHQIRPRPPQHEDKDFYLQDMKEFSHSDLRRHLEWINKKWESGFSKFQSPVQDNEQTQHASTISRNSALATPRKCSSAGKNSPGEESAYASSQKNQMQQLGPCTDKSAYRKTRNELRVQDYPTNLMMMQHC